MRSLPNRLLWLRANDWLKKYKPVVIGVTGSTGKSTAVAAITQALQGSYSVRSSSHSYTSPIDVALTIAGADLQQARPGWFSLLTNSFVKELREAEPQVLVLEVGADHPGDIDWLAQKVPFKIGVATNVGTAHLDMYVTKEMLAHEKTSLIVSLPKHGYAILNMDDPLVAVMGNGTPAQIVKFGSTRDAEVQIVRSERLSQGGLAVEIAVHGRRYEMHLPNVLAKHQLTAITAALTVAHVMGVDPNAAIKRLQSFRPPAGRLQRIVGISGSSILDDSQNSTPESMNEALQLLHELSATRKVAVLGDIAKIGKETNEVHKQIGLQAAQVANLIILIGESMRMAGTVALKQKADVHHFNTADAAGRWLTSFIKQGDLILVSGSRGMQMEKVVELLSAPQGK